MPEENSKTPTMLGIPEEHRQSQVSSSNGGPQESDSDCDKTTTRSESYLSLTKLKPLHKSRIPVVPMNLIFLVSVFSLTSYVVDVATDLLLVYSYYSSDHPNAVREGSLTLTFVILPCVGVLMDKFYRDSFLQTCTCSKERMREVLIGVKDALFIFFTTVKIYSLIVYHAWVGYWNESTRKKHRLLLEKLQNDAYGIRFYESTFEALPQLILQSILTMGDVHDKALEANASEIIRLLTIVTSLVSISWGISSYVSRSPTIINPLVVYQMSFLEKFLNFLGHVLVLGAHVLAMSLAFHGPEHAVVIVLSIVAIRCLVMVTYRKCDREKRVLKNFSQFALILVGICVPADDGDFSFTYKSYLLVFICDFLENTIFIAIWYEETEISLNYQYTFIIGHYVALMLGFLFMMLFYWRRHVNIRQRRKSIVILAPIPEDEDDKENRSRTPRDSAEPNV